MKTSHICTFLRMNCAAMLAIVCCLGAAIAAHAESVTYRIVEFNKSMGEFVLAPCGTKPFGSYAYFENDFGATSGNRYNQIPRNCQATLWLMGWEGCTIESVTLSLCSNNSSGSAALLVNVGEEQVFSMRAEDFNSESWFGRWVSKDLHVYVDVDHPIVPAATVGAGADVAITLKGGTREGSVYLNAVTVNYTPGPGVATESPLPWSFEKIEAKGKVNDGDVVMLFRNGDAAGDIDGMATQHYLDAIGVPSTTMVDDPAISLFTARSTEGGHWTLTNQYGERLGAKGAQQLAWDEGTDTWDITLGYDGATIASTNQKYGTLRHNAPSGSYPRFWNYTSKTLQLPYLYRRSHQQQPVVSKSLQLAFDSRELAYGTQDTIVVAHTLEPLNTTDQRVKWTSDNERVVSVRNGIVEVKGSGSATITATSADGGASASCKVSITVPCTPEIVLPITGGVLPHRGTLLWKCNGERLEKALRHQPQIINQPGKQGTRP